MPTNRLPARLDEHYRRCVSGKRARAQRNAVAEPLAGNARAALVTAERMLALDFADVPLERTTQVIVGWMRAAFEQSRVIATLALSGLAHAGAPNRRSFAEIVLRVLWLHGMPPEERAGAVDALLDDDRTQITKAFRHLADMGYDSPVDLSDLEAMVLEVSPVGVRRAQARQVVQAAKSTDGQSIGMYYVWREETQYTHATAVLGGAYAPERSGTLGSGRPPVVDGDLAVHRDVTTLVVALVYRLLVDEGVKEDRAMSVMNAFFSAS